MTVRRVIFEAGERRGGAKHDPSPSARWALVEFGSPRETGLALPTSRRRGASLATVTGPERGAAASRTDIRSLVRLDTDGPVFF